MKFLSITVFSVLCSVVQSGSFRACTLALLGEPFNNCSLPICTSDRTGLLVPAEACDDSLCQEASSDDTVDMKLYKIFTWNVLSEILGTYCPFESTTATSDSPVLTFTRSSGINCSDVSKYITSSSTDGKDFFSGKLSIFKYNQAGATWSMCRPYYVPGGPFVMRKCRIDPPPPPGKAFASIFVAKPADWNCESDAGLKNFLNNYPVEWLQKTVDCFF